MDNKILWDCHMHTSFSADSQTPMEQMIERAHALGLEGICFTEHLDSDYPPTPDNLDFSLDMKAYSETLFALKEQYSEKIQVNFGIELGLQEHLGDFFRGLVHTAPFDFVIGSSHVVHGYDPYYGDFFAGRAVQKCYREYFESILENVRGFEGMDVYGHLDYVVRYGPGQNKEYSYAKYSDILDEILRTLITRGIGIELNTGGYHYGLGEPNPCVDLIRRYRELGGEIITVGADAHGPDKVAYAFDKAAEVLKNCGFQYYTVFHSRKPDFLPL